MTIHTGGCQCGAVRYAIAAALDNPHICHCRMCQKAFGNFFAALAGTDRQNLTWTKGTPAVFRSSEAVDRGFCSQCGTPLYFTYRDSTRISVSIGSLDDPAAIAPEAQYGTESRHPSFGGLASLPGSRTEDDIPPAEMAKLRSRQHPDHD